jgi:hypothetical protein
MKSALPISMPFIQWLRKVQENRLLLWMAIPLISAPIILLKIIFPYPNFIPPDSHFYLEAAFLNKSINYWPIGYSNFLRLVSTFSHSHLVLTLFQYLLLQVSLLYLLFSVQYWLQLHKWAFRIIFIVSILNPLLPHISNFISSDALFAALSLVWFTQLIWLLLRPGNQLLFWHAIILLLAFMVRHNSLYYPFISLLVLYFIHLPVKVKWQGVAWIIGTLGLFIGYTQVRYQKLTDHTQYSAFAGWQLAANALYGYAHTLSDTNDIPKKFWKLHALTNHHLDSLRKLSSRPDEKPGIYYLWDDKAPLKQYMYESKKGDSSKDFKKWASMGPLYGAYGRYLIAGHPGAFLQHYVWPNVKNYYAPPPGFMSSYNQGDSIVPPIVATWFNWTDNKLPSRFQDKKIAVAAYFTVLLPVINLIFVTSFLAFLITAGLKVSLYYSNGIFWWIGLIWLTNMAFSVLAAPIELRYQLFPMIITLIFGMVLIDLILQYGRIAIVPIGSNAKSIRSMQV